VKPPPFGYAAPDTLEEAVQLLGQYGDEAKVLAGGQSLMPLLAFRLARPSLLVDINRIRGLETLHHLAGRLDLGSLTRHRTVELAGSPAVPAAITEAAAQIGHVAIRNRGTVGGSLAHADPSAEWGAVTLAYDGVIVARSVAGERRIPAAEFFLGYLTSALLPTEIVTRLELRLPDRPAGSAFAEFARRHGDFALGGVASVVGLADDRSVRHARVAVIGAGTRPVRCQAAEAALIGREVDGAAVADAAETIGPDLELTGADPAERRFRLQVAKTLTRRVLKAAAQRAETAASQRE
jgi:CO/xanthine dehydrogenase FAD-binding subunit